MVYPLDQRGVARGDAGQRVTVTVDVLGGRVEREVSAVLQRAEEVRTGEGVVDRQHRAARPRDLRQRRDVGYADGWVRQKLGGEELSIVAHGRTDRVEVGDVDARHHDTGAPGLFVEPGVGPGI